MFRKFFDFLKDRQNRPTIGIVSFFLIALFFFLYTLGFISLPDFSADKTKEDGEKEEMTPTPQPEADRPLDKTLTDEPNPTGKITPTGKKVVPTSTPKPTATNTPAPTAAATNTPRPTQTVTPTPTVIGTPTDTPTPTLTP